MTKFNYTEPEFKVIITATQDVMTASLEVASDEWDTNKVGGNISADDLFTM
jgi:hypothetical protein